jgi:hypothetical protein
MSVHISVNGEVKKVKGIYANINGETKKIISGWANKNGIVTKIYSSNTIDLSDILIDFTYVIEPNGTYLLTGWKGTYNGEPSTKIVIPDNPYIKL